MAKQDPKGNYGSPLTARLGVQFRNAATDIAKPTAAPAAVTPPPAAQEDREPKSDNVIDLEARREEQGRVTPKSEPRPVEHRPEAQQDTSTTSIRVILNLAEREGLDTLVNALTKKLGARVKLANLMRASIMLLMNAQEQILTRAEHASDQFEKRPANSDALAIAQFEDQLKDLLTSGLFDAARRG